MWAFSPSSETLLQRCVTAAQPLDKKNKWVKRFGHKLEKNQLITIENDENFIDISESIVEEASHIPEEVVPSEIEPITVMEIDEEIYDIIETDPVLRFETVHEECMKSPEFTIKLAEKLSVGAIERICYEIFTRKELENGFLDSIYVNFFPAYLKREQSLFSIDLLIQADKAYPLIFKKLVHKLFKNVEVPSKILQDLVQTYSEEQKILFFNNLLEIELTDSEFAHNLFTIYTLYKDVKKTDAIQNFMLTNLIKNSQSCAEEKNFGRLLLAYLQEQNNIGKVDKRIEKVIEINRTPFRKPCLNLLK